MMVDHDNQMASQRIGLCALTATLVLIGATAQAGTASPFAVFDGRRVGDGSVAMQDGSREAIQSQGTDMRASTVNLRRQ